MAEIFSTTDPNSAIPLFWPFRLFYVMLSSRSTNIFTFTTNLLRRLSYPALCPLFNEPSFHATYPRPDHVQSPFLPFYREDICAICTSPLSCNAKALVRHPLRQMIFSPSSRFPPHFQLVQPLPSPRGAPEAIYAQPTHHLQLSSGKRNRKHSFIKCPRTPRTPSAYLSDELSEYIPPPQRLPTGFQSSSRMSA